MGKGPCLFTDQETEVPGVPTGVGGHERGCWAVGPWLRVLTAFLDPPLAGALKLVQIPAGARHIQIEKLEKAPHRIGECRGAARPPELPTGLGELGEERVLMQGGFHKFE